ncbi:MAG TPA: tRNA (adenosine(37)-N6)-dimethylallyltransferase MiaA [Dictyobacter sp.]|nr:tRNA (adenosine(37)-N6)-dimethylallyltransferase MiaA [Dictyobacter sp.]
MKEESTALPNLIVILGPTASGKSALGIALAQHFHGEIVSADSRQVYRGLDIGTAKVTPAEQAIVPHHLLDVVDPDDVYSVSQFQQEAICVIDALLARDTVPFLVGGSPHYIQTVVDNFDIPAVAPHPELRAQLEARPLADLVAQLATLDPETVAAIDQQNPRRVIRALEVCLVTGKPFSQQRRVARPLYHCLQIGIQWPRNVLYQRIDERIDERMQQGLIQEVEGLLARGLSYERLDSFGLEYRFVSRWLRNEFASESEMVQRLKYASHDFTRRQLSWFRRDKRILWLDGGETLLAQGEMLVGDFLAQKEISL